MRITRANREAVHYSCLYFHYARCVPIYLYAYNIYNDTNEWCGCILFGLGACANISHKLNCIPGTCLELQRVALNGKQGHNATSKAVSLAMHQVKQDAVLLKCLFSFADTGQNHIGVIYQATNWLYVGISKGDTFYEKNGKKQHRRSIGTIRKRQNYKFTVTEMGYSSIRVADKYFYVYPYDKKLKRELLSKQKPYPKRAV